MRENHREEHLDALRERLYSRGNPPQETKREALTDTPHDVPTSWKREGAAQQTTKSAPRPAASESFSMNLSKGKYSYRVKILLTALCFFVAAVVLSSLFIVFGGNSISGENISISMSGPFTVGGGEEIPVQIGVTNHNSVPIESATLIVEYPSGTQSVEEEGKELFIERIPLDAIQSGETVNVPLRAKVFGEENEELQIHASIEYRVSGSNATFFKEAEPLRFKIGSSPVSLDVEAVHAISSGQETEIKLTVHSNASAPLADVLVRAEFPAGFDFTESSPSPVSGRNTWMIETLDPEESATITLKGVVIGSESEEKTMHFSVGVPSDRDRFALASVFSTASTDFLIEEPFLDVSVSVDGAENGELAAEPGKQSNVQVRIENTLSDTIYDGVVKVELGGNALSDVDVHVSSGFYDSNTRTVVWDSSSEPQLEELAPGASESFRFTVTPDTNALRTPQINLEVSVHARRVSEANVSETLLGSARASIKVASDVSLRAATGRNSGAFSDSGPVPPVVGETTTYTLTLTAESGSNDVADAAVTATLPSYVAWLGETSGDGSVSYSSADRAVMWDVGDIEANSSATAAFQVSLLPSASQIDTTPTLLGEQYLRAEDRFTGTVIRATSPAVTTDVGSAFGERSGRVQPAD